MNKIGKNNSIPLESCPHCNAQVRHDRIKKHILKVHSDLIKNQEEFEESEEEFEEFEEHDISWEELNTYETRFGEKYIGYLRREYDNSRFGSYPLHDDYSEESDNEGSTNLDY